jgi:hypothetical protein
MSKSDEYLAYVAECQRKADSSIEEEDKRPWLSLAQSWLGLVRERAEVEDSRIPNPLQPRASLPPRPGS